MVRMMLILNYMYMYFCGTDFSVILTFGHRCGLTGMSQSSSAYGLTCKIISFILPCPDFDRGQTPEPLGSESELRSFRKNNFGVQDRAWPAMLLKSLTTHTMVTGIVFPASVLELAPACLVTFICRSREQVFLMDS